MKRFKVKLIKDMQIGDDSFKRGDVLVLEASEEYAPAYWVVKDGIVSRDLLTNEFGKVFELVEEIEIAA